MQANSGIGVLNMKVQNMLYRSEYRALEGTCLLGLKLVVSHVALNPSLWLRWESVVWKFFQNSVMLCVIEGIRNTQYLTEPVED